MASTQIAQNLAFFNWTPPTGLAPGSYAAVVLLRHRSAGTSGFLDGRLRRRFRAVRGGHDPRGGAAGMSTR